jgi:hypothetical protein
MREPVASRQRLETGKAPFAKIAQGELRRQRLIHAWADCFRRLAITISAPPSDGR